MAGSMKLLICSFATLGVIFAVILIAVSMAGANRQRLERLRAACGQ